MRNALLRLFPAILSAAGVASCIEEGGPGEIAVYVEGTGGASGGAASFSVRVEVTGNHAACGSCDSLVAIVTGGAPPFAYEWSDPSFVGPGPHGVCPREDVRYAVAVTDSSGTLAGGRPLGAIGTAVLDCTAPAPDAGAGGGLKGCIPVPKQDPVSCSTNENSTTSTSRIEFPVEPGRTYQYTYTQLLPLGIGVASTADVYLGMSPCDLAQRAFTLTLDSTVTQSHCFVANAAYTHSTTVVHVNGIPLTFGVTATVCDSCPSGSWP